MLADVGVAVDGAGVMTLVGDTLTPVVGEAVDGAAVTVCVGAVVEAAAHLHSPSLLQGHQLCPRAHGAQWASVALAQLPFTLMHEPHPAAQSLEEGAVEVTSGVGATVLGGNVLSEPTMLISAQPQNFSGILDTSLEASRPPQVPLLSAPSHPICQSRLVVPAASFAVKYDLYPAATHELPVI